MATSEDLDWLRELHEQLTAHKSSGNFYSIPIVERQIRNDEWARVKQLIQEARLAVEPRNAGMGFNFGIAIYATPECIGAPAEFLLSLEGGHFGVRFAEAWDLMSPLSHNEDNERLLTFSGLEALRPMSAYEY